MDLDKSKYSVDVVSPRNHFLFTPLLASTAVGTLEFRAIQEPTRTITNLAYQQATVTSVDLERKIVHCEDAFVQGHSFQLEYDALILATGSETNTFGVKGISVANNVFFLKQLQDARAIRNRLIECFERASSPGCTADEQQQFLTFVVVGGGAINIEFASELHDFIERDVKRSYPDLIGKSKIVVIEASEKILGSFDTSLVSYVSKLFEKRRIEVLTKTSVKEIVDGKIAILSNGELPFGLMVWSTGIKQMPLVQNLPTTVCRAPRGGRLVIDKHLRLKASSSSSSSSTSTSTTIDGVFAIGDCAGDEFSPLPCLAQVASQQGIYLAKTFNSHAFEDVLASKENIKGFTYHHLGMMMTVGSWKGVVDATHVGTEESPIDNGPKLKGFAAFVLWRAAYLTKQVSITNKILLLVYWTKTMIFGRDISRF